jgi:hypothetical protein
MGGTPKWMIHDGKSYQNGFGAPILGNLQMEMWGYIIYPYVR